MRWINRSSIPVWPASDPHPTHTGFSGFDALGEVFQQESYRFAFSRAGEFAYHNHVQAQGSGAEWTATGFIRVVPSPILSSPVIPLPAPVSRPRLTAPPPPAPPPPLAPPAPPPEFRPPRPAPTAPSGPAGGPPPPVPAAQPAEPPKTYVVVFSAGGFSPQSLEIRVGDTVRWINDTDQPVWPASDPHPTHTGLSGFDALGDLLRGESYRYTFRQPGILPYHNHTVAKAELEPEVGVILVLP